MATELKQSKNAIAFSTFFEKLNVISLKGMEIISYLLPYLFFGRDKANEDCLCLRNQEEEMILNNLEITYIITREMTRRVEGGKYVDRRLAPINKDDAKGLLEWQEHLSKIEKGEITDQKGYIHLLFVKADGLEWTPCTMETFGSLFDYLLVPFQAACINEKKKLKFLIKKHTSCKKTSKSGFDYFCHYLLKQEEHWKVEEYSKSDMTEIENAFKENSEAITKWLSK